MNKLKGDKYTVSQIADDIRDKIMHKELSPDEKLVEVSLSQRYNTSRTSVREAFRILEREGIVQHTENRGVRVSSISLEDVKKSSEITQLLYCIAAREAAERIQEKDIEELRRLNEEMLQSGEGTHRNQLDRQFHNLIVQCADNAPLAEHCRIVDKNDVLISLILPIRDNRMEHSYQEHEQIIAALESHDAELAEAYMKLHYIQSRRSSQKKIREYNASLKGKKKKNQY